MSQLGTSESLKPASLVKQNNYAAYPPASARVIMRPVVDSDAELLQQAKAIADGTTSMLGTTAHVKALQRKIDRMMNIARGCQMHPYGGFIWSYEFGEGIDTVIRALERCDEDELLESIGATNAK
jgi:hypothetical protein